MLGLRAAQVVNSNHHHLLLKQIHRYRYLRLQQLHLPQLGYRPSTFLLQPGRSRSRSGSRGRISQNRQDCQHLARLGSRTGTELLKVNSARELQRRPGIRFYFVSRAMAESGEGDKTAAGSAAHKHTNRLVKEQSPYLLQHAHNPVDWYPWGEEAFSKARAEDKPIFLSVGYSTCHWCHVMEVESFENEEVAKLMNDWFVNIKVDREERPDVDKVYMTYVQATQGGGGWPMSVFLTPELKPIVGGTYFPPDDKYGRPGIKTVLKRVKEAWDQARDSLRETGDQVIQQLAGATATRGSTSELSEGSTLQAVQLCVSQLAKDYDSKLGGFGGPPKFPRPVELKAVLQQYKHLGQSGKEGAAAKVLELALFTMRSMAKGGIHDHVGGGFHRYSVDEYWHVPHFEKMLYDQGQLVNVFLDAFAITRDIQYASSARDVLEYIKRDMTDPDGGIYSAEDADSAESAGATRKKEGAFYVWTRQEIESILGEERSKIFCSHYYVKSGGNCDLSRISDPHREFAGKNVLIQRQSLAETATKFGKSPEEVAELLGSCRRDLHARRSARPRPLLDDKVIVAWNGLTISAFARASKVLATGPNDARFYFPVTQRKAQDYLADAVKAATYIQKKLYDGETGRLRRSFRVQQSAAPGFLEDYAFLIAGLLDLYEAGGGASSLCWAVELQNKQDELFWDSAGGGYYSTSGDDPSILFKVKEDYDGAEPSGNSVAAINLLRLSAFASGDQSDQYRRRAEHLLAVFESRIRDVAVAVPLLCCAFDSFHAASKRQIIISGQRLADNTSALLAVAHSLYDPEKTIIQIDPNDPDDVATWGKINPTALAMAQGGRKDTAVAYVCQNFSCKAPTSDPEALERILRQPISGPEITTFNLASSGLSK